MESHKKLFEVAKPNPDAEEGAEEGGAGPVGSVPDLLADAKVWQWANIGFGEYDTMILQKSIKELARKTNASSLKFWGKIKGNQKDYFIVEGAVEPGEPVDGGEPMETRGTGVNKFVYWVSNSPNGEWIELPDIKPS